MVAHNKNYKPSSQAPTPSQPHKPKPRWAGPKDEVSPLCETDLICELANPANSLEDICAAQRISLETLSLWMARRDVAERLDLVQTTAMNRARFIGRLTLPVAAQSAANIINAHSLRVQKPTIDSAFNTELHRANENMLKAARFLQRLTAEPAPKRSGSRSRKSESAPRNEGLHETVAPASEPSGNAVSQRTIHAGGEDAIPAIAEINTKSIADSASRTQPTHRSPRESKSLPRRRSNPRPSKARPRNSLRSRGHSEVNTSPASSSLASKPRNTRSAQPPPTRVEMNRKSPPHTNSLLRPEPTTPTPQALASAQTPAPRSASD